MGTHAKIRNSKWWMGFCFRCPGTGPKQARAGAIGGMGASWNIRTSNKWNFIYNDETGEPEAIEETFLDCRIIRRISYK